MCCLESPVIGKERSTLPPLLNDAAEQIAQAEQKDAQTICSH